MPMMMLVIISLSILARIAFFSFIVSVPGP
ncbi:hypothetical protein [Cohnella zeiphila]